MSTDAFTLLCHRTFSFQHNLSHQACCPSMDLALLTAPSTVTTENDCHDTINCLRLSDSTPQVWSVSVNSFFTENGWWVDLAGQPIEIDSDSKYDDIDALHWSPDGQCVIAALSSRSSSRPPAFILLSVHSGQLLSFPTLITFNDDNQKSSHLNLSQTSKQLNKINFVKWLPLPLVTLPHGQSDQKNQETCSVGQELCDRLPTNLTIPQLKNVQTLRNYMGPVYPSSSLKVKGKLYDHYPMIRLPPSLITDQDQPKQRPNASSLLILSSHVNKLHFFLNGTVYLGTTSLPDEAQLVAVRLLARDAPPTVALDALHRGGVQLKLVWLDSNHSIGFNTLDLLPSMLSPQPSPNKSSFHLNLLHVKPSLSVIGINSKELNRQVQLSNEIQGLLKDCFFAYFGIVKDWQVARSTGRKWYETFDDLSKAHNVTAPISFQMLELLFLGQSNEGLRDYLGTKSGERIFTKWQATVLGSLTRIRLAVIELLIPAAERLYILATELRLHTYAPFSSIKIIEDDDFESLLLVESLIRYSIKAIHTLDKLVREEETLFQHFCKWLRSEFDYVLALETSPTPPSRPKMKYDLMAVSKFIQRGDVNSLDKIIFPQFRSDAEDFKNLQETKEKLAKRFYNNFFDVNGPDRRAELKKKLSTVLSFGHHDKAHPRKDSVRDPSTTTHHHQSPAQLTPQLSHFPKPGPNVQFQTPNLAEHLKRQKEVAMTPSNASIYKLPQPSPSGPIIPSNSNFQDSSQPESQPHLNPLPGDHTSGLHACLTYASSLMSQVFEHIFSKIAMAKPMHRNTIHSENLSLKPMNRDIASRFIEDIHYAGYVVTMEQGREVLVIDRIAPLLEPTRDPHELEESQVIIDLKLPKSCMKEADQPGSTSLLKVLDLDFFDDIELVLLVRLESGFNVRYLLITLNFVQLFASSLPTLSELPVHRLHQLSSDYQPEKMSLNGAQWRRSGCVMSGQGRMIHGFDMEDTSSS